jgi:hypothetical protein
MTETQSSSQFSIDEILAAFAVFDGKYKRAEVDAAIANREEITPRLIDILEEVLANPNKVAEDQTCFAHMYALMLLGYFGEPKAHKTIIALASLREDLPYILFGDTILEDLANILLRTCNGSLEAIKGLIYDKGADDYCRGAAATAIAYGVVEEIVPRMEALSFLGQFLDEEIADESEAFHDMVASCIHDLYPEEMMDRIEAAYDKGLIHSGYIDFESFKNALSRGKERCLLDLRAKLKSISFDDIHARMSWWSCFDDPYWDPISPEFIATNTWKKKNKKAKRKIAKASRKRNRRKK